MNDFDALEGSDWIFRFITIMYIVGGIMLLLVWGVLPWISENELDNFCETQNYTDGEYGLTIWQKSYCLKYENNIIIKDEVDTCGNDWCFIESSQSGSSRKLEGSK